MLGREWQFDPERGAPANLRSEVYRTVVQLHNSERAGQSDSAASRSGGEKQLEDFLLVFRRDALTGVAYGDFRHFTAAAQHRRNCPPLGMASEALSTRLSTACFSKARST